MSTSVTRRAAAVTQPRGGFVKPSSFAVRQLDDGYPSPLDHKAENIHASLVGLAVDYLTRLGGGTEPREAFKVALMGAARLGENYFAGAATDVQSLRPGVVDAAAIAAACRLAGFDVVLRAGPSAYNPAARTNPDATTKRHISIMVDRSLRFFREYGPVTLDGFTMEGGYTDIVSSGDGDFLTRDTLWDFKVSVSKPTKVHTLQLLMYYLMGRRSSHREFQTIKYLGIFNPRLNIVSGVPIAEIPREVIDQVSREVIGY